MARRRSLWSLLIVAIVGAAVGIGNVVSTVDAAPGFPIRFVSDDEPMELVADGNYLITSFGRVLIDTRTRAERDLPFLVDAVTSNGRYAFTGEGPVGTGSFEITRLEIDTGGVERWTGEFGGFSDTDWSFRSVVAADDAGRYVLFDASNGNRSLTSSFVFDTVRDELVTPEPGLSSSGDRVVRGADIHVDGDFVRFTETGLVGQNVAGYVDFDLQDRTYRTISRQSDSASVRSPWVVSFNRRWALFFVNDPPAVVERDRLVRRDLLTGAVDTVPVPNADLDEIGSIDIGDNGMVAWTAEEPTRRQGDQLFVWDGTGAARQVTVRPDGGQPDDQVSAFALDFTGTRLMFSSRATDLAGGFDPNSGVVNRWFSATIDAPPPPSARVEQLLPGERLCAAARGANPGDFVGLNVTPVRGSRNGFVTAHAAGSDAGATSTANFAPGTIDPNVTFTEVGPSGQVCVTNGPSGSVDMIIDQIAVVETGFATPSDDGAVRLLDTRTTEPVGPDATICVALDPDAGDVAGVNITPVRASGPGFASVYPSNSSAGSTSNVNYDEGSINPNFTFTAVGSDGDICVRNGPGATVDLIIDHVIVTSSATLASPGQPGAERVLDTRTTGDRLAPGARVCFLVADPPGSVVGINLTPVRGGGVGFITLHSSDESPGATSSANYRTGSVDPNFAAAVVGSDGTVCATNSNAAAVDLVADQLVGARPDAIIAPTTEGSTRLADTR